MPFELSDLDERTRGYMLDELKRDADEGRLFLSPLLTDKGRALYPELLRAAVEAGTPESLAEAIRAENVLVERRPRRTPRGRVTSARVPAIAAQVLAEGEFNRYYMRGVCRRALDDGVETLEIYRARGSGRARRESEAKIGLRVVAADLLHDLRTHPGMTTRFGVPGGPNSGISVRIPAPRAPATAASAPEGEARESPPRA
jgi:hypothetical protein